MSSLEPSDRPTDGIGDRIEVRTPEQMHALGVRIGELLRAGDLVVLSGPLGAGKTTLCRGIGEGMGVRGPVTSPTFVLARSHPSLIGGPPLVHADAYRLSSALELDDLDLDFAGSAVVVEWGAGLLDGTADSWLEVRIERPSDRSQAADGPPQAEADEAPIERRIVTVTAAGERWRPLLVASALHMDAPPALG